MTTTKKPRRMARPAMVSSDDAASTSPVSNQTGAASLEKRVTKQSLVLDLLHREGGVPLAAIVEATGWQPHTTRAALTGLRKKGHPVTRAKVDGVTHYAILSVTAE